MKKSTGTSIKERLPYLVLFSGLAFVGLACFKMATRSDVTHSASTAVPIEQEDSPVTSDLQSKRTPSKSEDVAAGPNAAVVERPTTRLQSRLGDEKLASFVKSVTKGLAGYGSKAGKERFKINALRLASKGSVAEEKIRSAYAKLNDRESSTNRLALLLAAKQGNMSPTLLKDLGALELSFNAGVENVDSLPASDRELRALLMASAAALYLDDATTATETAMILAKTLAAERDPMVRASLIKIYFVRYPAEASTILNLDPNGSI